MPDFRVRCFACGRFCDEVPEEGPTPDEAGVTGRFAAGVLEVYSGAGPARPSDPPRAAVACWPCFWKTNPDYSISPRCWDSLQPKIPSARLPLLLERGFGVWNPTCYPWPEDGEETVETSGSETSAGGAGCSHSRRGGFYFTRRYSFFFSMRITGPKRPPGVW